MKKTANELRVVAQLMECEVLDEASKEFIQRTVTTAAQMVEESSRVKKPGSVVLTTFPSQVCR